MAILILLAVVLLAFGLWLAPDRLAAGITREGGILEGASAAVLGAGAVAAGVCLVRRPSWPWLSGTLMMLWACLRELDLQKRFTYRSIESTGFFLRDIASLETKIIAAATLAPFALAGLHLLWIGKDRVPAAARRRDPWVFFLAGAFVMLFLAQLAEKVLPAGKVWEETFELGFAAFLVLVVLKMPKAEPADSHKWRYDDG